MLTQGNKKLELEGPRPVAVEVAEAAEAEEGVVAVEEAEAR
jgi:hypothetical protein